MKTALPPKAKKSLQGMAAGLIGIAVALILWVPGWLERWELKTWDWRVHLLARPAPTTDRIRLILLDQESLDWGKRVNGLGWPWPREIYGLLLDFCRRQEAEAVFFDVLFTEPSTYGVEDDQAFGKAIRRSPPFIGSLFLSHRVGTEVRWPPSIPPNRLAIRDLDNWLRGPKADTLIFSRATFPVQEVATASRLLADTHINPDRDNVYRRVKLLTFFDGQVLPTPALGALLAKGPEKRLALSRDALWVGDRAVPIDDLGNAILNFRGPSGTYQAFNAAAVIQSELRIRQGESPPIIGKGLFKDRYVLFGLTAPGLFDLRPAAVSGVYPGVEIHATALDNLLSGDFIRPLPNALVLVMVLSLSLLAGVLTARAQGLLKGFLAYGLFLLLPVLTALAAYQGGFWLPLIVPETAVAVTLFSGGVIYYATEGR